MPFPATNFTKLTTAQRPDVNIFYTELYPSVQEVWSVIMKHIYTLTEPILTKSELGRIVCPIATPKFTKIQQIIWSPILG
jgi:hypothetical protein